MADRGVKDQLFEWNLWVRHAVAHRRRSRTPGEYALDGCVRPYWVHRYNVTWLNERAVEVPLGAEFLDRHRGRRTLELGNVMAHYGRRGHEVVDKYEVARGVHNVDVVDWRPDAPYDAILSLSTLEHVGQDEEPQEPEKALRAIEHLVSLLGPQGELLVTFPIGHNPALDEAVREQALPLSELRYLKRVSEDNRWEQVGRDDVLGARYGEPFPWANAVVVGRHQA